MSVLKPPELEQIRGAIAALPGVELALVFGSVARGDARADSDEDIAVLGVRLNLGEISARVSEA